MRVLISGATGYLGSLLAKAFIKRGDHVMALSRSPNQPRRLEHVSIEIFSADPSGIEQALASGPVDALVLTAGAYGRSGESAVDLIEANCLSPLRLALAAGKRVGRIVAIGTSLPAAVSPYARSKSQFADWLAELSGVEIADSDVIALEHFYGPHDDPSKFITRIARACLAGETLDLTAGTQRRDFIHIDDVISGIIKIVDNSQGGFRRIELGSGEAVTVRSVVEKIATLAGGKSELCFGRVPMRHGEPDCCVADITTLLKLGWRPSITLEQGLTQLIEMESRL